MKIICFNSLNSSEKDSIDNKFEVYFKPDSCLQNTGKPFYIPDFSVKMYCTLKFVVKINRLGKNIAEKFAHRYYSEVSIGADLETRLKTEAVGQDLSRCFDYSAITGEFINKETIDDLSVKLKKDDKIVDKCEIEEIYSTTNKYIEFISSYVTLKIGDMLFIDIGLKKEEINIKNTITGKFGKRELLNFWIL